MNIDEILKTITGEIAGMISTKTVIGEHITIDGRTIIPVTKVSFGFGSGGGEGKGRGGEGGTGSGGGAGAMIQPIAFLVVSKDEIQLLSLKGKSAITNLAEVMPEVMDKIKSIMQERKKEVPPETREEKEY